MSVFTGLVGRGLLSMLGWGRGGGAELDQLGLEREEGVRGGFRERHSSFRDGCMACVSWRVRVREERFLGVVELWLRINCRR